MNACAASKVLNVLMLATLVGVCLVPTASATDVEIVDTVGTNNVVVAGQFAFAAAGPTGFVIIDITNATVLDTVSPAVGTGRVDDVSVDGNFLFTLDGVAGGLSVFSIANPTLPVLVSGPVPSNVGPFAGASAANGRVVVSGGTGLVTVRNYNESGSLSGLISTIDLGIGQPDVLVSENGDSAFVSTDFAGSVNGQGFGITVIDLTSTPSTVLDQVGIPGAGFSPGTDGPANFPIESAQQGDTLFVASGSGISVFDISDLSSLTTITQIPLSTNPVNVDVVDDMLYVVGNSPSSTLTVIDVSELSAPVVETIALPGNGNPLGVAAISTHVIVADSDLGILIDTLIVPGDLTGDGVVNLLDVAPFVALLSLGGFQAEADLNGDGLVNLLDVQPFVSLLAGG